MGSITLPSSFNVQIEEGDAVDVGWFDAQPHFIVLYFGNYQIARWEWQPDRELEDRSEPGDDDADEFVAGKMIELFAGRI